jgi:hypothetical protein
MKNLETQRSNYIKNYLIENYSKRSKEEIKGDLGLSWSYIQKMAHLLNIKREFNESCKSFSLSKLLDESNISYYWIGFMIADAHITKFDSIQINVSEKDISHIFKLKEYIEDETIRINLKDGIVRLHLCDKPTVIKLKKNFKWKTNKTKNPIEIPKLKEDQLFSLIIGFIDGDGHINNKGSIIVKCDFNWKENLEFFYYTLTSKEREIKVTSDGYSIFSISHYPTLRNIKQKAISLNLPILNRKWNKIEIDKIMKYEKSKIVESLIHLKVKEIKEITGFSKSLIYSVKKTYRDLQRSL